MPILLWYIPFTVFYAGCDLLFAEFEMEANETPEDLDDARPEGEAITVGF
jgi:hypothetical protein